jgi:hypothetical protein
VLECSKVFEHKRSGVAVLQIGNDVVGITKNRLAFETTEASERSDGNWAVVV